MTRVEPARPPRWTGRLRRRLLRWVQIGAGALIGLLLVHFLVMPLFVRHGADTLVPDLRGLPLSSVEGQLAERALVRGDVTRAHDEHIPIGRIVRHNPPAGLRVKEGRGVDFIVSLGPAALRVPPLEGESLVHARFLLEQAGLALGKLRRIALSGQPADRIVATRPRPGTPLRGQAAVDLLVSSEGSPARYVMPAVRGRAPGATAAALRAQGFSVRQRNLPGLGGGDGRILEQTPPAGYPVRRGGTIELIVGE